MGNCTGGERKIAAKIAKQLQFPERVGAIDHGISLEDIERAIIVFQNNAKEQGEARAFTDLVVEHAINGSAGANESLAPALFSVALCSDSEGTVVTIHQIVQALKATDLFQTAPSGKGGNSPAGLGSNPSSKQTSPALENAVCSCVWAFGQLQSVEQILDTQVPGLLNKLEMLERRGTRATEGTLINANEKFRNTLLHCISPKRFVTGLILTCKSTDFSYKFRLLQSVCGERLVAERPKLFSSWVSFAKAFEQAYEVAFAFTAAFNIEYNWRENESPKKKEAIDGFRDHGGVMGLYVNHVMGEATYLQYPDELKTTRGQVISPGEVYRFCKASLEYRRVSQVLRGVPVNLEVGTIDLYEREGLASVDSKSGVTQKERYDCFENDRKQVFLRSANQVKGYFSCKLEVESIEPHEAWEDIFHSYMQSCETLYAGKPESLCRILEELNFIVLYTYISLECAAEFLCEKFDCMHLSDTPTDIWKALYEENIPEIHRAIQHGAHVSAKNLIYDKSLLKVACTLSENVFYTLLSFRHNDCMVWEDELMSVAATAGNTKVMEMLSILYHDDGKSKIYNLGYGVGRPAIGRWATPTPFHRVCSMVSTNVLSVLKTMFEFEGQLLDYRTIVTAPGSSQACANESRVECFFRVLIAVDNQNKTGLDYALLNGKMGSEIVGYLLELMRRVQLEEEDKPLYVHSTCAYAFVEASKLLPEDTSNILAETPWVSRAQVDSTLTRYINDCRTHATGREVYGSVDPATILRSMSDSESNQKKSSSKQTVFTGRTLGQMVRELSLVRDAMQKSKESS
jgi:hypothetical protein